MTRTCEGPGAGHACPNSVEVTGKRKRCKRCVESYKKLYALEQYHKKNGNFGKAIMAAAGAKERRPWGSPRLGRSDLASKIRMEMPDSSGWACKRCGCTELHGCFPPCSWVGKKLCSACATAEELYLYTLAGKLGKLGQLFNGVFKDPKIKKEEPKKKEVVVAVVKPPRPARKNFLELTAVLAKIPAKKGVKLKHLVELFKCNPTTMNKALKQLMKMKKVKATAEVSKKRKVGRAPMLYTKA